MAWTAPRTWVTAEVVTAAIMNTHVRDNFLETAPAAATTAGDVVYADAANSMARLAKGTDANFLRGGDTPTWGTTIGSASNNGLLTIVGSAPDLRIQDLDAADDQDYWGFLGNTEEFRLRRWDDSTTTSTDSLNLWPGDFLLHSGAKGQGTGAVVIATDTAGPVALGTSGTVYLDATGLITGGPAYVRGWWMVEIQRNNTTTPAQVSILPRNDGVNLDVAMSYGSDNTGIRDLLDTANDVHTYTGMFWERHTATDTSDYEIFVVCDTNTRFQANSGHLYVESMPYPT